MSVSCWLRTITFPSSNQVVFADNASKLAFGFYQGKHAIVSCETAVEIFTNINTVWKNAEWNHIVLTKTNDTYALYINNTLITSRGASNYWTHNKTNSLIIGCRYNGSYATFYDGEINDFRLFASALTAAQVKDLFETPISLSNSQVLFTKELIERSYVSSSLTKKGVTKSDTLAAFADLHNMPLRLIDDGSVWARVHWIDFSISKTPFTNDEVQECVNADNRFSLMKYIENFKANDGTYEFLLTYPQHATKADKYNRWKQTNSPNAAYGAGTGYETVGGSQPFGTHLAPLTKCSSSGSAVYCTNTTSNWWSPVGQKVLYNSTGIPAADGSTQLEMELWVRVDTIPNNIKLQIFNNCIQSTDFIEW